MKTLVKNINWNNIKITISEIKEGSNLSFSNTYSFIDINFEDSRNHNKLRIKFTKVFLKWKEAELNENQKINFNPIINEEIEKFINYKTNNILYNNSYFIKYKGKWREPLYWYNNLTEE